MARKTTQTRKAVVTALAWAIGFLIFFPILWTILMSFKSEGDAIKAPLDMLAAPWSLESYGEVQTRSNYALHFWNSVILSFGSTLLALVIAIPAAWAMAFVPGKRTKDLLMWMLSTKMMPAAAVLYPMTYIAKSLELFDTHFLVIMVLCLINLPIVVWMLFTYFKEIPKDIIEAGKMDGVNTWGEIKEILIPLAWGGIASTALLCFIFCWNEAYWTVRLTTIDAATLSKLIEGNRAPEGLFFGRLSAVSAAAVGPIIVLGWFCQKQLVQGLTFGAVK
jgi:sorbitol/mannitol transport system permease protein